MLIKNKTTGKYYINGKGFIGNRDEASRVDGVTALAICLCYENAETEDV